MDTSDEGLSPNGIHERELLVSSPEEQGFLQQQSRKGVYKFMIFLLSGLMPFGAYFGYDSINAVSKYLEQDANFSQTQIGALYSAYSFPNLIMVLIGGFLIDKWGTNRMTLLFSIFIVTGSLIVALSSSFYIMIIGRIIFGMGSESTIVAQSTILSVWFSGEDDEKPVATPSQQQQQQDEDKPPNQQMALAFGGALTLGRAGSLSAILLLTWVADLTKGFTWSLWIVFFVCVLCFFLTFCLNVLNIYGGVPKAGPATITIVSDAPTPFLNSNSSRLRVCNTFIQPFITFLYELKPILSFPRTFWLIGAICFATYGTVFSFLTFSLSFLEKEWGYSPTEASRIASIITLSSMICSPIFGFVIDRIGRRVTIMIVGQLLLIPCMIAMSWSGTSDSQSSNGDAWNPTIPSDGWLRVLTPYPWVAIIGFAYSLAPAAMWPCVPLVIDPRSVGLAFGVITVCQNASGVVVPLVLGRIKDWSGNYMIGHFVLAGLAASGAFFCIILRWESWRQGDYLESPSGKKPAQTYQILE
eukprot:TRINITY_DN11515_c0_g1_i1.p1 TRINITY_DN11515_c0_g1~~TRINITY_DN11515_c0_g1_i1.p1  ORF type:complete len:527 (+),score=77.72 TRINITY_DN11515_c0_g1_i1:42-1622(+)